MRLTNNFTLAEFTRSETAERLLIPNYPSAIEIERINETALALQWLRDNIFKAQMFITSGYRSAELNAVVGWAANSAHQLGWAADFICPDFGESFAVCKAIAKSGIEFDQLINEQVTCHFGLYSPTGAQRHEILSTRAGKGYVRGIVRL